MGSVLVLPLTGEAGAGLGSLVSPMVLLAQRPGVAAVTWRLPSAPLAPTGAPPTHHRGEGVGRVPSKDQEEESGRAGAQGSGGQGSAGV